MKVKIIQIKENSVIFYLLLVGIVSFAVFYIYFVNNAVHNVVLREKIENRIAIMQTEVSDLEYRYMETENQMTLEGALTLGLVEPSQKNFLSKNPSGEKLSLYNR